jgi:hypothetical protein
MADKETHTQWDHISGEAFDGPLKGKFLKTWPVFITNAGSELFAHPDAQLFSSGYRSLIKWFLGLFSGLMGIHKGGFIPPNFYRSMSNPIDPRLPKLTQGLGVIVGKRAKYYPMDQILRGESITNKWGRRIMTIDRSGTDGIPRAIWKNTGEIPMQLLSRWYGFAFTYPNCEIYKYEKEKA